jgi:hypothetical protein
MFVRFWHWAKRDWHVNRDLVFLYIAACLWFPATHDGFVLANQVYHGVTGFVIAMLISIDSALRRFTGRSFLFDI